VLLSYSNTRNEGLVFDTGEMDGAANMAATGEARETGSEVRVNQSSISERASLSQW